MGMIKRLDMAEMEPCLQHHDSRAGLHVSSVANAFRRPALTTLATKRRYHILFLTVGVILAICCWVEFRIGKRSISIVSSGAHVEVDGSFVRKIQRTYDKHHEPQCEASSSSSSSKKHRCGTGGTILCLQCPEAEAALTAGNLVKQSLAAYNPTLVCAQEAVSSPSLSLQTIMEQKYDLVLVENRRPSSKEGFIHDNLDFWKAMLVPQGILARFCCSKLVTRKSPRFRTKPSPPTSMNLIPWSSPQLQDQFLSRVATIYKSKICNLRNKQGLFCQGDILSLDCNHGPSLQLLQEVMPGRGTMYCPKNTEGSSTSSNNTTLKFQKQVPLEELFQRPYETIILDPSNNYPSNLELWSQLLVPSGIIAISGTSTENPKPSDEYLKTLDLEAFYQSSKPPYYLFFVKGQDVRIKDKARVDEATVFKKYQPNQGKVDAQIQLSPVSSEDRYPTLYRSVSNELLQNHPSSSSSCTKINKSGKDRTETDSSNSCGPIKVLSFGCSYGFEMKSLADKYFTGKADIYGVDVNDAVVTKAQENVQIVESNKMVVLNGKMDPASKYGPFDAVFANSVLCYNRFPEPKDPVAKIKSMFSFESFEGLLHEIDGLVKVGGFLSLANTNYLFNQTSLFQAKYQTYHDQDAPLCRQDVWLLDKDGTVIFNLHADDRSVYTMHCVFVKVKE